MPRVLMALATNTLTNLTDVEISKYDYVITQYDRAGRIAGVKKRNPNIKFILYMEGFMVNALGSSGIAKAEADANPNWYLRVAPAFAIVNSTPLDTFNRANENPLAGGWLSTDTTGAANDCQILTNQMATVTGASEAVWGTTFGPDCEAYFTISTFSGGGFDLSVRMHNLGGSRQGYSLEAGSSNFQFYRFDSGTAVPVGAVFGSAPASGDIYYIRCQGSTFEFWRNRAATWSLIGTRIDSTYNVAGKIAVSIWNTTARADDFGGGNITGSQSSTFPIESTAFPNNWLCDQTNTGYQNQWAQNVINRLVGSDKSSRWDGVFIDDCNISYTPQYSGDVQDPNRYAVLLNDTQFTANTRAFIVNVSAKIKALGFLFIPNIQNGASLTTYTDWIGISTVDGAVREFFKKYGTGDTTGITPQEPPISNSRFITTTFDSDQAYQSVAPTKLQISITYGALVDTVMQEYGYAAFLLDWDGTTTLYGYAFFEQGVTTDPWNKYWTSTNIGKPVGAKYNRNVDSNLWQRDYTNGVVILNSKATAVTLGMNAYRPLVDLERIPVQQSVLLNPATAKILLFPASIPTFGWRS